MNWQSVTALVIVGVVVGLALYDLLAFAFVGNDATISKTLLDVSRRSAGFALAFVFALGVFVGHVFLSQSAPKDPPEEPKA